MGRGFGLAPFPMARKPAKPDPRRVKVAVPEAIHDGDGGFHKVGETIVCPTESIAQSLRDKRLAN